MIQETPLSIKEIAGELNSGTATLKFILRRFSPWLPFDLIDGLHYYSRNTLPVLIKIQESLGAGLLPSEIDQELKTKTQESSNPMESGQKESSPTEADPKAEPSFLEQPNEDIRVSKDGLTLIKSLFDDIAIQQNRVAAAHEKRATAEERKAVAIEKRAEAEEKKAIAMNNIATALQEMNQHRRHDPDTREIARKAAQVMALDTNQDMELPDLEDTNPLDRDPLDREQSDREQLDRDQQVREPQEYPEIFDSPDPPIDLLEASEIQMDDLSDLIEEDILLEDPLVDVQNISKNNMSEGPGESRGKLDTAPELDDLAALIGQEDQAPLSINPETKVLEMDDLSLLLEPTPAPDILDDLSSLIDTVSTKDSPKTDLPLDDLSLLIEDSPSLVTPELDDLSLLIEAPTDDLSLLIDTPKEESQAPVDMDDLDALISKPTSLKPDITPEENLKEYKATVMKIILGLKTENLSAQETTHRLNQDGIQTISGKSQWSEQAISQIYKFIDSAK